MMNKEALYDVTESIDDGIRAVIYALDRIKDCGLVDSEQRMIEDHLRKSRRLLDMAYDVVALADDEGDRP